MLTRAQVDAVFDAFIAKDLDRVVAQFADDAVLIDPHYPEPRMVGSTAIRQGLGWGLGNLVRPGFAIRNLLIDGDKAAIEVDTHHVFKGGMKLRLAQLFLLEARDGKIQRLQAYVPYGPPGVAGLLTRLTRWVWKLQGKIGRAGLTPA